jgi:hypothetical protein
VTTGPAGRRTWRGLGGLLGAALLLSGVAIAAPQDPAPGTEAGPDPEFVPAPTPEAAPTPAPTRAPGSATAPVPGSASEAGPGPDEEAWLEQRRMELERELGVLIERFDSFFGDQQKSDMESPSTRLRFRTFGRTAQDRRFSWGSSFAASAHLPGLQDRLGNARLVMSGQSTSPGDPVALAGNLPADGVAIQGTQADGDVTDLSRNRGSVELRFDLLRRRGVVIDTGGGVAFAWPPVPFTRFRGHLRVPLGAGLVFRGTQVLFVELGPRGLGTSTDLLVDRFLWPALRLRWEGHGLVARTTRGIEWNTLVGAEWKVHRRTGLYSGVGANGFQRPDPGLDAWRTWIGVRQDLWRGRLFAELEPQVGWPRPAGMPRQEVVGVTLRLELVVEGRPPDHRLP